MTVFHSTLGSFKQLAYCCGGLGIKLTHDGEGAKITAYAIIHLDNSCRPIDGGGATHACVHGRGSDTQSACATSLGLPTLPLEAQISVVAQALLKGEVASDTHQVLMWGSNPLAAKTGLDKPETARAPTIGELIG